MRSKIFLLLLLVPFLLSGQLELDEEILPAAGDVYFSFIDSEPDVRMGKQGRDQFWNFTSLRSGLLYEKQSLAPDPVLIFNAVDYDFFTQEGAVLKLYKRINRSVYEVAIQRPHPLNSDFVLLSKYEKPLLTSYAPLKYRAERTNRSLIQYDMPGEDIPGLIRSRLPVSADSIRLKVQTVRDFRVDAEGTMSLSYDRYDVLRQEVISRVSTSVEIYSAGKWSAINNNVLDPTAELLGVERTKEYYFFSDEVDSPLAHVALNEDNRVVEVEVKAPEEKSKFVEAGSKEQLLVLSPNPTYGDVKLEIMNLESGTYDFSVFNVIGKKLWSEKLDINRKLNSYKFNFGFLGKGTYLWAMTDDQGVRITTKRLVIVTP